MELSSLESLSGRVTRSTIIVGTIPSQHYTESLNILNLQIQKQSKQKAAKRRIKSVYWVRNGRKEISLPRIANFELASGTGPE